VYGAKSAPSLHQSSNRWVGFAWSRVSSADRFNAHRDLLTGKAEIAVPHGASRNKFLKGPELVSFPVGVVEIFVEDDDCARHDALRQQGKDRPRRGVEVAVDVNERNRSGICFEPPRNAALEPTRMQPHIVGHSWKPTSGVKRALTEIVAAPVLGQA